MYHPKNNSPQTGIHKTRHIYTDVILRNAFCPDAAEDSYPVAAIQQYAVNYVRQKDNDKPSRQSPEIDLAYGFGFLKPMQYVDIIS